MTDLIESLRHYMAVAEAVRGAGVQEKVTGDSDYDQGYADGVSDFGDALEEAMNKL